MHQDELIADARERRLVREVTAARRARHRRRRRLLH
jgi:hypothetical protein